MELTQLLRPRLCRIARELHDDLSQRLALLAIEIEQLGQKPPRGAEAIRGATARAVGADTGYLF